MKRFLLLITVITLIGCIPATTPIRSIKKASAVPAKNIFYKSENSVNNVIFVRNRGIVLCYAAAYLFMKVDPIYEKIKLANLEEGDYYFHVEAHQYVGTLEN